MSEEEIPARLREIAADAADEEADVLRSAADTLESCDDRIDTLETELAETNEGMVALTLELEEAEERYRSLFENAVEGIYKTTPDGRRYVLANESMADILGYDSAATLQRSVDDIREDVFVDPDRYDAYKSTLRDAGEIESFEYRIRRADGEIRWVSDNARLLYDDGDLAGHRGGIIDITELKAYEERLEQRSEELEALNRVLRHDINNDMQVIRGSAEYLEGEVDQPAREIVQKIVRTSDHVIDLTADARHFIETMEDEGDPDLEQTALEPLLQAVFERQQETFDEADFEFSSDITGVTVRANELLSSVFRNLLANAVHHNTAEKPRVRLEATRSGETVRVAVKDNGSAVPDSRKESIFGKGAQSIDSEGTGIGLYLVRELVDSYSGDVWVEDRTDGNDGAVFVVELPVMDAGAV
jgi:PAS domain S-box-containing protein